MIAWTPGRIAFLWIASLVPGLSVLADSVGIFARDKWLEAVGYAPIYAWAVLPPRPKIEQMANYAALVAMLGLLLFGAFYVSWRNRGGLHLSRANTAALLLYLFACAALPLVMPLGAIGSVWLVLAAALPAFVATHRPKGASDRDERTEKTLRHVIIVGGALVLLIVLLYASAWNPILRFQNDYADLPEYTRMSNGHWVENSQFLQEHGVPGRAEIDPCSGDIAGGLCVTIPRHAFRGPREAFNLFPSGSGLHYNWDDQKLRAYRVPTPGQCLLIDALLHSEQSVCTQMDTEQTNQKAEVSFSSEVAEFQQKNRATLGEQQRPGAFFFHHSYFYLPILRYLDSATSDAALLPSRYGYGLTVSLGSILEWLGSKSFQDFFALYWVGPGLYIVLVAFSAYVLTKRFELAISAAILVLALLPFQSVDGLRLAPGFNPWRHLPDLICLLAIGLDATRPSWISVMLRAASIAGLCWWNLEFGLFMLVGSSVWHLLAVLQQPRLVVGEGGRLLLEVSGSAMVLIAISGVTGTNELAFYTLLGVGAPLTRWSELLGYAMVWLVLFGIVAWLRFRPEQLRATATLDVAGVGICYAAFAMTSSLWNSSPGHISAVWVCASLPLVCLFDVASQAAERQLAVPAAWSRAYLMISLGTITLATSVAAATQAKAHFSRLFNDHRTYAWNLPGISGQTTADPEPIAGAIDLMNKEQPSGAVVLVSRYDSVLHIASGRLSKLPYVDVPSALIGWPIIDAIASQIETARVPVVFMDRDIFAEREWQYAGEYSGFAGSQQDSDVFRIGGLASFQANKGLVTPQPRELRHDDSIRGVSATYQRVGHLTALAALARQVSACYDPGPVGGVLRAWYRRCKD